MIQQNYFQVMCSKYINGRFVVSPNNEKIRKDWQFSRVYIHATNAVTRRYLDDTDVSGNMEFFA
jgi:hypothetical protein